MNLPWSFWYSTAHVRYCHANKDKHDETDAYPDTIIRGLSKRKVAHECHLTSQSQNLCNSNPDGDRTHDHLVKSQALCLLSYRTVVLVIRSCVHQKGT